METVTQIQVAWELKKAGRSVQEIAGQLGRHRATVYRWLKGIRMRGIQGYLRYFKRCKQGHRQRKRHGAIVQRVLSVRRAYRECCGEKIVYLLAQEGIVLSLSSVYRILGKHVDLRKHRRRFKGTPIQVASQPRQVVQMDTVDLGEVFAYTAIDTFTREVQVVIRPSLEAADGTIAVEQIMAAFGRVQQVQTDGGSEFKAECAQTIHQHADHHRIARPYKKNEQAFIESFNGTLRREEFGRTPFSRADLAAVQQRVDVFLHYYHHQRPHLSLACLTPALFLQSLCRI